MWYLYKVLVIEDLLRIDLLLVFNQFLVGGCKYIHYGVGFRFITFTKSRRYCYYVIKIPTCSTSGKALKPRTIRA